MFDDQGTERHEPAGHVDDSLPYVSGGPIEVDLRGVDDSGHGTALSEATRLTMQAEAARIEIIASALATGAHIEDGHRDTAAWVRCLLDVSRADSLQLVGRGQLAAQFPQYLQVLRDGLVHLGHYDEIVRAYRNRRARHWLEDFVDEFVETARALPFTDFQHAVTVWIELADQDGLEPPDIDDDRNFTLRKKRDGSSTPTGRLGAAATATFEEIFTRFLDEENRIDRESAIAAGTPGEYPRSLAQRRADAFMALVTQSATTPPGKPAKPLVTIVVSWHTAQLALAGLDGSTEPVSLRQQLCRTTGGQTLPTSAVLDAMITGKVQVLIQDAVGNPFALGAPGSLFTGGLRDSIIGPSAHCDVPGCLVPHRHLEADHVIPRSRGGPTSPDNGAAVCGRHNTWRHNHGYHLWKDPDGRWHLLRPDGTSTDGHPGPTQP